MTVLEPLLSAHLADEYTALVGVKVVTLDEGARGITLRPWPEDWRETSRTCRDGTPTNDLAPGGPAGFRVDQEADAGEFWTLDNRFEAI